MMIYFLEGVGVGLLVAFLYARSLILFALGRMQDHEKELLRIVLLNVRRRVTGKASP